MTAAYQLFDAKNGIVCTKLQAVEATNKFEDKKKKKEEKLCGNTYLAKNYHLP